MGVTGFGMAQVIPEGRGVSYDTQTQGYITRYTHITYGLGFIVTENMKDDGVAVTKSIARAGSLAFSMRTTKETVCANVLNDAFSNASPGGDGKAMCADDHPNKSGGTWRNELETPADLSESSLEQACIDIGAFETDKGLPIRIIPVRLIIPKELQFEAMRVLRSELQSNSANNDLNALRESGSIPAVSINHYLTDTDAWFLKTNCPDGMKFINRKSDTFDTEDDWDTSNAKFKAKMRFSCGHSDPRGVFGSPGG